MSTNQSTRGDAVALAACAAAGAVAFAIGVWLSERLSSSKSVDVRLDPHSRSWKPMPTTAEAPTACCAPKEEEVPEMPKRMREALVRKGETTESAFKPRCATESPKACCDKACAPACTDHHEVPEMPTRMRDAHARQLATNWEGFLERVPAKEFTKAEPSKAEHVKPQLGSVMALAKDTGRPRDECRAALIACQNDYDRAKASLMPDAVLSQAPSGVTIEGEYEPAEKFDGGRPGWMFKSGPHGLGYYKHKDPLPACIPAAKGG